MVASAEKPTDAQIFSIVVRKAIRNTFSWGIAAGVVGIVGQWMPTIGVVVAVPFTIILVVSALWCVVGILLGALIAIGRLFGVEPAKPYDAPYMWAAGAVRVIEGAVYLAYSTVLYRLILS